ncbi:hypothetical protein NDU88_008660, partial [Pleurodeles waltl]
FLSSSLTDHPKTSHEQQDSQEQFLGKFRDDLSNGIKDYRVHSGGACKGKKNTGSG